MDGEGEPRQVCGTKGGLMGRQPWLPIRASTPPGDSLMTDIKND